MKSRTILGSSALVGAVIGPAWASAQETGTPDRALELAGFEVLDTVYVTDAKGTPREDVAASVALIPGEAVEANAAIRAGDVLAAAPGIFLSGLNGPREIVQIRQPLAFDNRTLFLEDGVALQSPIFFDQSALGYSQLLSSPGGVEVLRGPGTALYGSDALSGIVHVRTRAPGDDLRFGARARGGEFGLFDLQAEAGGQLGDAHGLRATLALSGEDGFRDETAFHRSQGVVRHSYEGRRWSAESGLYVTDYETESATAIPLDTLERGAGASGLDPAVDPEAAVETGSLVRLQSRLRADLGPAWSLDLTPYWRRQTSNATAVFQPATTPREEADVETYGLLPRLRHTTARSETIVGLDVELTELDIFTFQSRPDAVVFGDLFRQGVQFDYTVDFRALSPFIQHERRFGPVTLKLGLRHDDLHYDFDNALTEVPGDARLQVPDREDDFNALSPKASLFWDVSDRHALFLRYARGFRVPRASELYELEAGQAEFELEPETLDSVELGWRASSARWQGELVGYWQVSRDGVLTDVQTAAGNISVNAGSQRFAGVEASLSGDLGAGLTARAVFAWQDFRFRERAASGDDPFDGNRIAEAPRTLANLVVEWTPPAQDRLTLTGRLRHIGPWPLNDANTLFSDSEYLLTLQGEWRLSEHLFADIRVENVTDNSYAVFADAPVFAPDGRARPGGPRTVSAGIRLRY